MCRAMSSNVVIEESQHVCLEYQYVVSFVNKRDYYHVPIALYEVSALDSLQTDFYCPDWLHSILFYIKPFAMGKIIGRHSLSLPSRKVALPGFFDECKTLAKRLFGNTTSLNPQRNIRVGQAAAKRALTYGIGGIYYSYAWPGAVEMLEARKSRAPQVVFQLHPLPHQVRRILEADMQVHGNNQLFLLDYELRLSVADIERYNESLHLADAFLVASNFVRQGLVEIGIPESKIYVIPYGADTRDTVYKQEQYLNGSLCGSETLKLLWVGSLVQRKAPHHLFKALRQLPSNRYSLTMVCRTAPDSYLRSLVPKNTKFLNGVSSLQLVELFQSHHVFVMPSIVEGFGLVYLESLWHGTPIICTQNTGAYDLIRHGVHGFSLPAGDVEGLSKLLAELMDNPRRLLQMRSACRELSRTYTWERFRRGVIAAIASIEKQFKL